MLPILVARLRAPSLLVGLALVLTSPLHHQVWLAGLGGIAILASVVSTFVTVSPVEREPMTVQAPVRGRWIAVNSPADKVPSHGVHSAGQTYAIDLVHWPDPAVQWKGLQREHLTQPPAAFPGFGQPILAPADGTVVRVRSWWRDHWSRNSWPALAYFFLEGTVRELTGADALLGNHVVIDVGDGTYAVLAHLKRRSVVVEKGQRVTAGQPVGACGNSGNTTEPHLHFQLMDNARAAYAAGLPFRFADHDTPRNGQPLVRRT